MKFFRLGFLAALAMAVFGQQAYAADPVFKVDPKVQAQSMKDAPPLVQAAGLNCNVSNAYLIGNGEDKTSGKTIKTAVYEVACGQGELGYFFVSKPGAEAGLFDCLTLKDAADKAVASKQKPGNTCQLPENKDPVQGLKPLLTKAGVECPTLSTGAWVGASAADKMQVYEAACSNGVGYLILNPGPGSTKMLQAVDCTKASTVGIDCTLTSKDDIQKHIISLSGPANKPACMPDKARWVVNDPASNNDYYEIGCSDGKTSFMMQTDGKGAFKAVVECVRATRIAGGCTFSNADAGQTADIATYQKLTTQIGSDCKVSKYQSYGPESGNTNREIVELACGEGQAGQFALVPTGGGATGAFYNCVRAGTLGLNCHLSPMPATYSKISSQIAGRGKVTCAVDGGRSVGKDDKGQDYVEVTCGSAPSLVLTYSRLPQETLISAVTCDQAPIANACTLKKK